MPERDCRRGSDDRCGIRQRQRSITIRSSCSRPHVVWTGDRLTVYEPSQFVYGLKNNVAERLGIEPEKVRAVSSYVGGAFGSKGTMTPRTALVALAARRLNRPVKLVATRDQGFTIATYRAETRHHIRLGANRDGKLVGYSHEGWEISSRPDPYVVAGVEDSAQLYAFGAVATKVNIVRADRNTPGYMRSPPVVPYIYALESAMDEMAARLGIDPVEFRRINDTMTEPGGRQTIFEPVADDLLRSGGGGIRLESRAIRSLEACGTATGSSDGDVPPRCILPTSVPRLRVSG